MKLFIVEMPEGTGEADEVVAAHISDWLSAKLKSRGVPFVACRALDMDEINTLIADFEDEE